jgi:hypothetical protein
MNATALWKSIEAWAERHRALLGAFGHALAFAVLFGGVALAALTSGFTDTAESALIGALAILFVRLYARLIPRAQRLIDRLHPSASPAKPEFPNWALAIYALIGLALVLVIVTQLDFYAPAAMALFIGWAFGRYVLEYCWTRRTRPETPKALDIIDDWLDAVADRHRPLLRVLGTVAGFVLLSGGVALYAWPSGVTRVAGAACGPACAALPAFETMIAAACGAAAVLFVIVYTRLALAAQRIFIDPLKFVRPGPKPETAAKWATVLHVILGFILLFVMTGVGQMRIPGALKISGDAPEGAGLLLGWWVGGGIVLRFFWAHWRRREIVT